MKTQILKQFKLVSVILALAFAVTAKADPKADSEAVENTKAVVYDLKHLKEDVVTKDILALDGAAGAYQSYTMAAEIAVRYQTAAQLYLRVAQDPNISVEVKRKVMPELADALRTIFITGGRQHGDDPIDTHKDAEAKAKGGVTNGQAQVMRYLKTLANDLLGIVADPFIFKRSADGVLTNKIKERMIRDILGQDLTIETQKVIMAMGDIQKEGSDDAFRLAFSVPLKEKEDARDLGGAEKLLEVRGTRRLAHYSVLGVLAGVGALWTLTGWDFMGTFGGSYSESTVRMSDTIVFGALTALAMVKEVTGSSKLIPALKRLVEMANEPKVQREFSVIKTPILSKLLRSRAKFEEAKKTCRLKLNLEGSSSSAATTK